MHYNGEHLLPGQLGHIFLTLSFVSALAAMISFIISTQQKDPIESELWKKIGRYSFGINVVTIVSIFALLIFMMSQHYFEYFYVWNHSDSSLEPKFLLSSIWEGQEGSFLLWAFWQGLLGLFIMRKSYVLEAPVMTVFSFAQLCLATMIMGVYVLGVKIGSNPFLLLRDSDVLTPDSAPFFFENGVLKADYLDFILKKGGQGLNQLLQNYWMVIHPPILFLGFASTIVPFSFAIAGLWKKDYSGWSKTLLPWSLFSAAVLGLGIMMGAKWAYESLNFGGYWAWDPVENASLVPWLILVAAIHTHLIFMKTGHSLRTTYMFYILTFLLILYSTYLTRSGDLQETSVHAFTNLGMNWQLRIFVMVFALPSILLFIIRYKNIPHIEKEEHLYSREFWMFVGSLVLFLSGLAIIIPTSFPLFNKVFGSNLAIGADQEFAYNKIQVFVAIFIGLLTAVGQYFKFKQTPLDGFRKQMLLPSLLAVLVYASTFLLGGVHYDKFGTVFLVSIHLALFASIYAVIANGSYLIKTQRTKIRQAGGSVAHVGFGLFLVGVLISSANKEVLSVNKLNPLNFGADNKENGEENLTLFQGIQTDMGKYWATYVKDSSTNNGKFMYFHILMQKKDSSPAFTLYPDLIKNTKGMEGFSNNPDAKHYWNKDIFSYISYADKMDDGEDTAQFKNVEMHIKDTSFYSSGFVILDTVGLNMSMDRAQFQPTDTAVVAKVTVVPIKGKPVSIYPYLTLKDNSVTLIPDTVISQGLAIQLSKVAGANTFELGVKESSRLTPFVALKVLQFPMINLVWLGTLIMLTGFAMSMRWRIIKK